MTTERVNAPRMRTKVQLIGLSHSAINSPEFFVSPETVKAAVRVYCANSPEVTESPTGQTFMETQIVPLEPLNPENDPGSGQKDNL